MGLGWEEELECEVSYTGCDWGMVPNLNILDQSGTDETDCRRKVARGMQLECARVLQESLVVSVLM